MPDLSDPLNSREVPSSVGASGLQSFMDAEQVQTRYRDLIAQSNEGIWCCELDSPIPIDLPVDEQVALIMERAYLAECNDAMARMYGFEKREQMLGRRLTEFFPESEGRAYLSVFVASAYRLADIESTELDRDGKTLYFSNNLIGTIKDGKILRAWGAQKDITKEVETRTGLKRSEERLRMASDAGRVGIWEWDIVSGELFWSERVKVIYGIPRDHVIKLADFRESIHPDDRAMMEARIQKALDPLSTEPYVSKHRILVNDQIRWVQGFGEVAFDDKGRPLRMSGTVVDITEQVLAEMNAIQLRELGNAFAKVMTLEEIAGVVVSYAVEYLQADEVACYRMLPGKLVLIRAHGFPPSLEERIATLGPDSEVPCSDAGFQGRAIFIDNPEDLPRLYPRLADYGTFKQSMAAIPLILGTRVLGVICLGFHRAQSFHGDMQRFVLTFADQCTQAMERARLYETERSARKDAEAASQAKSRFLANMSHEIRTPLGAILGFAELMNDAEISDQERTECIDRILRNGRLLADVIDDILDLSKIESERLEIERLDFELIPLVEDVLGLLSLKVQEKRLCVQVMADPGLPRVIHSDPTRLKQILVNLIGNAVKFTAQGRIDVRISRCKNQRSGTPQLLFSVCDTGIGIADEHKERIFEPFVQADTSTTRKFGGTGLGLVVSRGLAEALGGELYLVASKLGEGSTFAFTIDAPHPALPAPAARPKGTSSGLLAPDELQGIRVLLVDDGPDNRLLIGRFLSASGASLKTASDGLQAIECALADDFDIVLMDIQMPGVDGFGAIAHLRKQGYEVPILALTAHAMKGDKELSLKAGFVDHLAKPVNREQLIKAVKNYARRGLDASPNSQGS